MTALDTRTHIRTIARRTLPGADRSGAAGMLLSRRRRRTSRNRSGSPCPSGAYRSGATRGSAAFLVTRRWNLSAVRRNRRHAQLALGRGGRAHTSVGLWHGFGTALFAVTLYFSLHRHVRCRRPAARRRDARPWCSTDLIERTSKHPERESPEAHGAPGPHSVRGADRRAPGRRLAPSSGTGSTIHYEPARAHPFAGRRQGARRAPTLRQLARRDAPRHHPDRGRAMPATWRRTSAWSS